MKRVLICLEQLNIGGIETAVLTQIRVFSKHNYQVFVMSRSGIYVNQLKELGVTFIEFDYKLVNRYEVSNEFFEDIIIKYQIDEVHIHQYPCVLYWLPTLLRLKVPYIAYVHSIIEGTYEWFMETYHIYKTAFYLFFVHAYKIICITESVKKRHIELFGIDSTKYLVVPNSLDFSQFSVKRSVQKIENILLVSRLCEEKRASVEYVLEFLNHSNFSVKVVGDGPLKDEFVNKFTNIEFMGKTDQVVKFLEQSDLIFAVDRSALEAIAMKRLVVLCSYNGGLTFVNHTTIKKAGKENFSGMNFLDNKNGVDLDKILAITPKEYKKIVNENYDYILENFDAYKNIYLKECSFVDVDTSLFMFSSFNQLENEKELLCEEKEALWKQHQADLAYLQSIIQNQEETITSINNEFIVKLVHRIQAYFHREKSND